MRQQVGPVILVEERHGVEHVEGVSVGQLHAREGGLLGEDLFDVGRQERVRGEEGLAQRALGGGFELLLGGALEAVRMKLAFCASGRGGLELLAHVLFFEHFCGVYANEWTDVFQRLTEDRMRQKFRGYLVVVAAVNDGLESQLTGSSLEFIDSPAMDKIERWRGKSQTCNQRGSFKQATAAAFQSALLEQVY